MGWDPTPGYATPRLKQLVSEAGLGWIKLHGSRESDRAPADAMTT